MLARATGRDANQEEAGCLLDMLFIVIKGFGQCPSSRILMRFSRTHTGNEKECCTCMSHMLWKSCRVTAEKCELVVGGLYRSE